jgi:hypothetical protein
MGTGLFADVIRVRTGMFHAKSSRLQLQRPEGAAKQHPVYPAGALHPLRELAEKEFTPDCRLISAEHGLLAPSNYCDGRSNEVVPKRSFGSSRDP